MNKMWLLICGFVSVNAAEFTLSQALREALEHNPGYQAWSNDVHFAEETSDSSIAGYLPTITANGAYSKSWLDTHQERVGNAITDQNGAQSVSRTAGVNADWILFQGLSTPISRRRLRTQVDLTRAYESQSREGLLRNTALAYADLVRQIRLARAMDTLAAISFERVSILKRSLAAGAASRSDWLSAQVDWSADQAALFRQKSVLQSARITLGQLLGRDKAVSEDVDTVELVNNTSLGVDALLSGLPDRRPELRIAQNNLTLAELGAKQRATNWLPRLDALAGYNYSLTNTPANIVLENRTLGPSVGLQLSFNLFTGEFPWQSYSRARIAVTSAELRQRDVLSAAQAEVMQNHTAYMAADSALALESQALGYAKENLGLTFTRWKSGSLSYVDARHAQEQYLDALTRSENTAFEALRARLDLLRSAGRLESLVDSASR